ncbi:MAG TPA: hypothetical protein VI233_17185 [Puia sp.]
MDTLDLVKESYQRLSTDELIRIARTPQTLELEAIPLLQKELITRNCPDEALSLTDFLLHSPVKLSFMSIEELQKLVFDRLESGESIESIKIDLKENGIDILDIINAESKERERAFDYMLSLKEQGLHEIEVKEKIQETFSIDENASEVLHAQFRSRGWQNLVVGSVFVGIVGIALLLCINGHFSLGVGAAIVAAAGVWRITKGRRQLR